MNFWVAIIFLVAMGKIDRLQIGDCGNRRSNPNSADRFLIDLYNLVQISNNIKYI